jgi:hypothetical protein
LILALGLASVAGCGLRTSSFGSGWLGRSGSDSSLAASSESTSSVPVASASRVSIAGSKPVDAYVSLGGRIKSCWFNADVPLLRDYVYRADVSADSSTVQITVHQRQPLGRPGLLTYIIDFKQDGPATVVTTENRNMPPNLAAKMQYDIERWKRGESNCNNEMPKTAAIPAAVR